MLTAETMATQAVAAPELEDAVLGAVLLEPTLLDELSALIGPEMFHAPRNGALFREMQEMRNKGLAVDLVTVSRRMASAGGLSEPFGAVELAGLQGRVISLANVGTYALIIKEKYMARELRRVGMQIASMASDAELDIDDVLTAANHSLEQVYGIAAYGGSSHIGRSAGLALEKAEQRQVRAANGEPCGIPTGLAGLDALIGGWQPSTLNILAARPSMGKTALMIHFARTAAQAGYPGCIYSLEMSSLSLAGRMLLAESGVDPIRYRSGQLTPGDWKALELARERLDGYPIYIDDNPVVSMRYVRNHSTAMKRRGRCSWVMMDYLQLADMSLGERGRNREQEVAQASRQAKILAKELDVPVILLSQLSRGVEQRGSRRPTLSDLRDSGSIEQDADTVTFIYRPAYYREETIETRSDGTLPTDFFGMLYVEKNREGATGSVKFLHDRPMGRIMDFSPALQRELIENNK